MIKDLDALYKFNARSERFDIMKMMAETKMAEGSSVGEHVVNMIGYAERLALLVLIPLEMRLLSPYGSQITTTTVMGTCNAMI